MLRNSNRYWILVAGCRIILKMIFSRIQHPVSSIDSILSSWYFKIVCQSEAELHR